MVVSTWRTTPSAESAPVASSQGTAFRGVGIRLRPDDASRRCGHARHGDARRRTQSGDAFERTHHFQRCVAMTSPRRTTRREAPVLAVYALLFDFSRD